MRLIRGGLAVACGGVILAGAASASTSGVSLTLVAYSTPKDAYAKIIPAFQNTAGGRGVGFTQSYGPSADQSRAVLNGLPADLVAFSLAPDLTRLIKPG